MEIIDNVTYTLAEDLKKTLKKGSKVSIASACFSIYAFEELKKELSSVDSLRFIFTSPTFLNEKVPREKKEFYIPRLSRERNVYGTEFEIKLRNNLTQKAIAKECADWIRKKAEFRSNVSYRPMDSMINIESSDDSVNYRPVNEFSAVGIGSERGNSISMYTTKSGGQEAKSMFQLFDQIWNSKNLLQDVKEEILDSLTVAYDENSPEFLYFVTLYNIFKEFLEDISEDNLPNEGVGFRDSEIWKLLYSFQKDAAKAIINKLETYNGCILADSVGLGKTFTALAVMKYYQCRNKDVLVLCPKKLCDNWKVYKANVKNNILIKDKFRYDLRFHTDLSRRTGKTWDGLDLDQISWENYDLVVIDESHNFRNGGDVDEEDEGEGLNRYNRLINEVIRGGVKTKVLMLSATPVNNRFYDLFNQLRIAYEGDPELINKNLDVDRSLNRIFSDAQKAFNRWSTLDESERTTENLLKELDYDFFQVLDAVTIARSRRHIEKYYGLDEVGKFPKRLPPISLSPSITHKDFGITFEGINQALQQLNLEIYVPTDFIHESKKDKYIAPGTISRAGREKGIRRLMAINLLKRLESSVYSFKSTVDKVLGRIDRTLDNISNFEKNRTGSILINDSEDDIEDSDSQYAFEHELKIELEDMDYKLWKKYLEEDRIVLKNLSELVGQVKPEYDEKLQTLKRYIGEKIANPINPGNKKILIFTTFSDTADYLYENLSSELHDKYGLNVAEITGSVDGKSTIKGLKCEFNNILTWFSPVSKHRELLKVEAKEDIDILIGTDCISEGQNLQDCDVCVNYDIHWNPVRIIQRFGSVDRIGSQNDNIQLVNFWPDINLDEYIQLKPRVESRMKISVLTSTGDDNVIDASEKGDLEYRKNQLNRLKTEVVDIEDMQSGISIMDLGLNEFRTDLIEYVKNNGSLDQTPCGLHAIVPASEDIPPGCIFILRNRVDNINKEKKNRLHPFYMVYLDTNGNVICDHLNPKHLLDIMRFTCRRHDAPYADLCRAFNEETDNGRKMGHISELLSDAISSIIDVSDQSDLDDFMNGKPVSFNSVKIKGLDDFELVSFLVVR